LRRDLSGDREAFFEFQVYPEIQAESGTDKQRRPAKSPRNKNKMTPQAMEFS
jgi:hypothetical protein